MSTMQKAEIGPGDRPAEWHQACIDTLRAVQAQFTASTPLLADAIAFHEGCLNGA